MKFAFCGDIHTSQYSSIVRKRGKKYSARLENIIESINWFNRLAEEQGCFAAFFMGDMLDKAEMNAEEISAVKEIKWAKMSNYFLCGNHEMESINHSYSSANIFSLLDTGEVFAQPTKFMLGGIEFCMLPYILNSERKSLEEYFGKYTGQKRIILSHNDIAGIQMGKFISESGFSIDEIEANCTRFINGHLHNGAKITDKIINIGNITGQNFSEDAYKYDHVAFILDSDTMQIEVFENPYAFNFYKIDAIEQTPNLEAIKNNAVITLKCLDSDLDHYKQKLSSMPNVIDYRTVVQADLTKKVDTTLLQEDLTVDHLKAFKDYMLETLDNTTELMEELSEVLK